MKLMLLNLVLLLLVRDDGRYASSPLKPWFESLRNGWGQSCCDVTDGIEVVDGDWDTRNGHYRVRLASGWTVVPDEAVTGFCNAVLECMGRASVPRRGPRLVLRNGD